MATTLQVFPEIQTGLSSSLATIVPSTKPGYSTVTRGIEPTLAAG